MKITGLAKPIVLLLLLALPLHATEERPKIGLVLGGGGALGFAHIGVLQVLEELQIPVDYIGGTSMGAIVAGMYASGMTPEEIEQQFIEINWWDVLKDRSPNQFLTYRRKEENKRFMGTEFGFNDWKFMFSPGMAYGQKLDNVLETFSINSVGIVDFDQLNIPYRAVATDLRSGTSVALKTGNLAQAMRASMAVPGIFTPVNMENMVLVDGGILNNIPVDVVKAMGADIIIAVDVGASIAKKGEKSDFNALGDVVSRTYMIMQRPAQVEQLDGADLVIAPELADHSPAQFHLAREIIPRGRVAAEKLHDQLRQLAVDDSAFAGYLEKQRHKNAEKIEITSIRINGNKTVAESTIRNRIRSKEGPLQLATVYDDLNRIHGMGLFQTVTYDLEPSADGYTLDYNTTEKFWGPAYLHFGMKLEAATDASILWSLLLNYTRTQLNPLGGEIRIDLQGGGHKRSINGEWYQPASRSGRFFIAPSLMASNEDIDFYVGDVVFAQVDQSLAFGKLDAGVSLFEYGELRVGMLGGYATADGNSGLILFDREDDTVAAPTASIRMDQLDDPVFPTRGYRLRLDGLFASEDMGSSQTFDSLTMEAMLPFTLGDHTLIPKVQAGTSFGTELPFYALYELGGIGKFAGYAPYQLYGYYYGIGSLGYRYRIGKLPPTIGNGIFALLRGDVGNAWLDASDAEFDNITYGGLAGLSADTLVGTCTLAVGKAENFDPRFYFSIGNNF